MVTMEVSPHVCFGKEWRALFFFVLGARKGEAENSALGDCELKVLSIGYVYLGTSEQVRGRCQVIFVNCD